MTISVGDTVRYKKGKEFHSPQGEYKQPTYTVKCVHGSDFFLLAGGSGQRCEKHGTSWITSLLEVEKVEIYYPSQTLTVDSLRHAIKQMQQPKLKKTFMSSISTLAKKFLDPSLKTLIEAGYMTNDLELTQDGAFALQAILVESNKDALVAAAQEVLDAQKS